MQMRLKDTNNIWIESSQMRKNRYDITTANRKSRQGSGLKIVHRSHMAVKCRGRANLRTFEYVFLQAYPNNVTLTILAIYHPTYSDTNKAMTSQFIDEFTEFLAKFLTEYGNIIILGDINIQWNNKEDPDTRIYIDTITALGLDQHVDFSTHKSGNILDHIYTKALSNCKVLSCSELFYPLDHAAVECILSAPKEDIDIKTIKYIKLHETDTDSFIWDLQDIEIISHMEDVNQMVDLYETTLNEALNKYAPTISKTIVTRPKKPWYSDSVKWQKAGSKKKRKDMDKIQTTPTLDSTPSQMIKEQNHTQHYQTIRQWDSWIGNNTKKLYSLVKHLTGTTPNNPLPEHEEITLANEFTVFFIGKIKKIK